MAEKTNQTYPLAPTNGYTRSDGESLLSVDELKRKKRIKLAIYVSVFIVFQIIVITVISLTVMKVKTPKVRLDIINIENLNSVPTTPSFDTKFTTQIRVKNTNWGPYKFDTGIVTFQYQGVTAGQVGGALTLNSAAKLTGKVELMLIIKKKRSSTMDCTIAFDVSSKVVKSLQCK